jgi:hypothetical protein
VRGQFPVFYGIPPEIPKGDNINHKMVQKWPARASYISQRKAARIRRNFNKRGAK